MPVGDLYRELLKGVNSKQHSRAVFSVRQDVESIIVSSSEIPVGVLYRELLKGVNSEQ